LTTYQAELEKASAEWVKYGRGPFTGRDLDIETERAPRMVNVIDAEIRRREIVAKSE